MKYIPFIRTISRFSYIQEIKRHSCLGLNQLIILQLKYTNKKMHHTTSEMAAWRDYLAYIGTSIYSCLR